jgi:hypothetical protein
MGPDVEQDLPVVALTNWAAPTYFTRLYPIGQLRNLYPAEKLELPYIPISQEQTVSTDAGFAAWRASDPIARTVNACLPAVIKGVVSDSVRAIVVGNTLILHSEQNAHTATEKMLVALRDLPNAKSNLITTAESKAALVQIKAEIGYSPEIVKRIAMARITPNEWDLLGGSEKIIALEKFLVVPTWTIEKEQFMNLLVWLFEQPNLLSKARSDRLADRQSAMNTLAEWIASDDENKVAYAASISPLLDEFNPALSDAISAKFLEAGIQPIIDVPFALLLAESLPNVSMPAVTRDPEMLNLLKRTKPGTYKRRKWLEVANNLPNSAALQSEAFQSATTSEIIILLENLEKYRESHDGILQRALERLDDKVLVEDHFNSYSFIRNIVLEYDPDLNLIEQQIEKLQNDPDGGERANNLRYRLIGYPTVGGFF